MAFVPDKYATPYERGRIATIRRLLPAGPGRALDLGCGPGVISAALAGRGFAVFGADRDPVALDQARRRVPSGTFVEADLLMAELPAGPFDVIAACEVIEHFALPEQRALLERIRGRLAANGHLILSSPNTLSMMSVIGGIVYPLRGRRWDCGDATHDHVHSAPSLAALLAEHGFRVERRLGFQVLAHRPWAVARFGMRAFSGPLAWLCYDQVLDVVPRRPSKA